VLAGDAAEVVLERVERGVVRASFRGHGVQDLGVAVDLHPGAVPVVGEHQHRRATGAPDVAGLRALGVGRDHQPPLAVDAAGHGGGLRGAVLALGEQDEVVTRAHEVEELVEPDPVGGGDGARHG
jgi:hypothetical protein